MARHRPLAILDRFEGLDRDWYRRERVVVRFGSQARRALVYVCKTTAPGRPARGYHDRIVLPAARDWRLPEEYLAELEGWLTR